RRLDQLSLAVRRNLPVAQKRGENVSMPEVLRPGFHFFRRQIESHRIADKRMSDAMGMELGQADCNEGALNDVSSAVAGCPCLAGNFNGREAALGIKSHLR